MVCPVCKALDASLENADEKWTFFSCSPNCEAVWIPLSVNGESTQPCALCKWLSNVSPCQAT